MRLARGALGALAALVIGALVVPAVTSGLRALRASSAEPALFVDATEWSGLATTARGCPRGGDDQYLVTGQAWGDVNRDGHPDLYLTSRCGPSALLEGGGDGRFRPSPLNDRVAFGDRQVGGAMFGDLDGDGWVDLLVLTYDGPRLFHNDAGRDLIDVTEPAGLSPIAGAHPMSAAAADYDHDGALDLFIANYGCVRCVPGPRDAVRSQLLHNRGDGRFDDVSTLLGRHGQLGFSFVGGWADLDDDADPDLYVTNDVRGGHSLAGNVLFRNDGPGCGGWCFSDAAASGADVRSDAMGLAVADFDGDRSLDLFVTNSGWAYTPLTGPSMLLSNSPSGTFTEVAGDVGAAIDAMTWGAAPLDADDDGWTDLYVALGTDPAGVGGGSTVNHLLRNEGGGRFSDASRRSGAADAADSLGVVAGDANGDGQTDLVVGDYDGGYRLYLGTGGGATAGHRLVVRLRGGDRTNVDAIGARLEVLLSDGRRLVHEVRLGGTLGGNDDPSYRVGTGTATVRELSVRWPDGSRAITTAVPADRVVTWTAGRPPIIEPLPPIAPIAPTVPAGGGAAATTSGSDPAPAVAVALIASALLAVALGWQRQGQRQRRGAEPSEAPATAGQPSQRIGGCRFPVVLPSWRDSRLQVAAVVTTLQVLGQTVFAFRLSIAQILVTLLTSAAIEVAVTLRRSAVIAWPASALLTGNGIAFILRVPGTRHGDWWSLRGWWIYVGIAAVSVGSKYLLRDGDRQLFNPSNLGLVLGFVLLGSARTEPLDFWWGHHPVATQVARATIVLGALVVLTRVGLAGMAVAFWCTFAAALGALALRGHCISARWSLDSVCGARFWWVVTTSPELLVFACFMVTDPKTAPAGRLARAGFGAAVGVAAALLAAPQHSERATKVAVLAGLFVVTAARAVGRTAASVASTPRRLPAAGRPARVAVAVVGVVALVAGAVEVAGLPARQGTPVSLAGGSLVARPRVSIDADDLPPVTVDGQVSELLGTVTADSAAEMARDLAANLAIEKLALEQVDVELARTATVGQRRRELERAIAAAKQGEAVSVSTFTFESIRLVVVFDSANGQAGPQLGLEVMGSERRQVYGASGNRTPTRVDVLPCELTFALARTTGAYLTAASFPKVPSAGAT